MKIPPKTPLNALDLTSQRPGQSAPAAAAALQRLDLDQTGRQVQGPASQHDQLTEQTQKWVAQTFFGTLMKQMSDSPFKSELFSGGRGGEAFSSLYHQQLVDRMSQAAGSKLVNGIVRRIEANNSKSKEQGPGEPVRPSEKQGSARPNSDADPRTKAYDRARPGRGGGRPALSLAA